jgi:hypothetical protein
MHFDLVQFEMITEVKFPKSGREAEEGSFNDKSSAKNKND